MSPATEVRDDIHLVTSACRPVYQLRVRKASDYFFVVSQNIHVVLQMVDAYLLLLGRCWRKRKPRFSAYSRQTLYPSDQRSRLRSIFIGYNMMQTINDNTGNTIQALMLLSFFLLHIDKTRRHTNPHTHTLTQTNNKQKQHTQA